VGRWLRRVGRAFARLVRAGSQGAFDAVLDAIARGETATRGWTLRKRVAVSAALIASVLVLLAVAIVTSLTVAVGDGNDAVNRWGPARLTAQELLTDMVNQETGVRGYALSGRVEALQPYALYSVQEPMDLAQLRVLIGNRPGLIARVDGFSAAVDAWRTRTAQPLIDLVAGGGPTNSIRVDSGADVARFDLIRSRAADLVGALSRELGRARSARTAAIGWLIAFLALGAVLIAVAGLATWRALQASVLDPIGRLAAQVRQVAEGRPGARVVPRGPPELVALGNDVEAMRRTAAAALADVEMASAELRRSNADLEQFAYVASHDLSEPLRKVANFCLLLERQYGSVLDETARGYIGFAVDGARRMQQLIADLLILSRVGRTTEAFVPVDTAAALDQALANLSDQIDAAGAGIGHSDLPTLPGDAALLSALFENLIGNAIKYRRDEPPIVVVTAVRDAAIGVWTFTVKDNGIGIAPEHAERIFAIFQRLHLRDSYPGTGIGLAICRKIVEFHGGRIWLDTGESDIGATFRFTLPERRPEYRASPAELAV
jgi:signal transduction histidine kinase